jgi:hypothetical protein
VEKHEQLSIIVFKIFKKICDLFSNYNCKTVHKLACLISKNISNKSSENSLNTFILSTLKLIKNTDISHMSF